MQPCSKDIVITEYNAAEEFMNQLLRWRFRICKCYLSGLGIASVHMNSKAAGLQKTACYCNAYPTTRIKQFKSFFFSVMLRVPPPRVTQLEHHMEAKDKVKGPEGAQRVP